MKYYLILLLTLLSCSPSFAQYYYQDIISASESRKQFQLFMRHRISQVLVKAYDSDGTEIKDFILQQIVDLEKRTMITYSKSAFSDASILKTEYNARRYPILVLDSADGGSTLTRYEYDSQDRLKTMSSSSIQVAQKENTTNEVRLYSYDEKGQPVEMRRIKGGTDTMIVRFTAADNGLPGQEEWWKDGKKIETWYYYYDEKGMLTDIVRYNQAARKMLPDYLFGYDDKGNLTTRVTVQPGTSQFRTWQYTYDHRGLKIQESVMNRERKPEGRLVYTYKE